MRTKIRSGGNDGLMESMEDRTMKLPGLPPFPQSLEITRSGDFTHSYRTTTTDISTLQRSGHLNFAVTDSGST
jgi:hypothetical protein